VSEATEEHFEREFLEAHAALTAAGFDHYEVSNYGRPGFHSRHNWAYWERRPYAGLGPAAHEFDGDVRRWNVDAYAAWASVAGSRRDPVAGSETLTGEQSAAEQVYLGLRTSAGLRIDASQREEVERFIDAGWAELSDGERLRLATPGWLRLDAIAGALTLVRSR
jgi:oxygen-independent coproporphyrinogen-3 oxidase